MTEGQPGTRRSLSISHVTGAHRAALVSGVLGALAGVVGGLYVTLAGIENPLLAFFGSTPAQAAVKGAVGGAGVGTLFGYILGMGFWSDDGEAPEPGDPTP